MWDRVVVAGYVTFYDPLEVFAACAVEAFANIGHGIIGASVGPESIGISTKVCFPYGFENHTKGFLYNPIADPGNAEGPGFPVGFWDVHPSDRHRFKGPGLE